MNSNDSIPTPIKLGLQFPKSLLQKAVDFGRSLITWEGREVSTLNDADFLRKDASWEENLNLFTGASTSLSKTALMTKKLYCWLPKEDYITEGFNSSNDQIAAKGSEAYMKWLQVGIITGVSFAFFKAMEMNFNCLDEMEKSNCNMQYGEIIAQPRVLAKVAFATGVWVLGGLLINSFSTFGFYGDIKRYQLSTELLSIYKDIASNANAAFWNAVKTKDQVKAEKLYQQAKHLKNSKDYYNSLAKLYLGFSDISTIHEKMTRALDSFIEDVSNQDLKLLFAPPSTNEQSLDLLIKNEEAQNQINEAMA